MSTCVMAAMGIFCLNLSSRVDLDWEDDALGREGIGKRVLDVLSSMPVFLCSVTPSR